MISSLGLIYFFYRIIYLIILSNKITNNKKSIILIKNPTAFVMYINRKNNYYCPGLIIKGLVAGKLKKIKLYYISLSKKQFIELAKEISSLSEIEYEVIYKTNIVFNQMETDLDFNSESNTLITKCSKVFNLQTNKEKIVKFHPIAFEIEKLFTVLKNTDFIEELYILNKYNKYVCLKVLPEYELDPRQYLIDNKEHTLFDLYTFLLAYNFVVNEEITIFEQIDGNSPELLINNKLNI